MSFAVIKFLGDGSFSEVPVSWLDHDESSCWWPRCKNPAAFMMKGLLPEPDSGNWFLYDVVVESYAGIKFFIFFFIKTSVGHVSESMHVRDCVKLI